MKKITSLILAVIMVLMLVPVLPVSAAEITPKQPEKGTGTAADPYQIGTAEELYWFADEVNKNGHRNACAILTDDIVVNVADEIAGIRTAPEDILFIQISYILLVHQGRGILAR